MRQAENFEQDLKLFWEVLCLNGDPAALSRLRLALMSDSNALGNVVAAADRRMLLSVIICKLQRFGLLDTRQSVSDPLSRQISDAHCSHIERRRKLLAGLREIVTLLNKEDVVPMLLKGSISLWNQRPEWRQQRDIDILVQAEESARAFEVLRSAGFVPMQDQSPAPHHLHPLIRDDIPASVEIHFASSNPRGERYLKTAEFRQNSIRSDTTGGTVTLSGPVPQLLHIVVHNHFTHRNATYGVAPLKGLYEFNWQVANSSDDEIASMYARAGRNARLLAATDLWLAAIQDLFKTTIPGGIQPPQDAILRWAQLSRRSRDCELPSLATAYWEESTMAAARSKGFRDAVKAWWQPLAEVATAPIWIDRNEQALKSAGINSL